MLESRKLEQDDGPSVDEFNVQLEALGENASWFKAPWLYAEYGCLARYVWPEPLMFLCRCYLLVTTL